MAVEVELVHSVDHGDQDVHPDVELPALVQQRVLDVLLQHDRPVGELYEVCDRVQVRGYDDASASVRVLPGLQDPEVPRAVDRVEVERYGDSRVLLALQRLLAVALQDPVDLLEARELGVHEAADGHREGQHLEELVGVEEGLVLREEGFEVVEQVHLVAELVVADQVVVQSDGPDELPVLEAAFGLGDAAETRAGRDAVLRAAVAPLFEVSEALVRALRRLLLRGFFLEGVVYGRVRVLGALLPRGVGQQRVEELVHLGVLPELEEYFVAAEAVQVLPDGVQGVVVHVVAAEVQRLG